MLSPKLLDLLRDWWRRHRPPHWLFAGDRPDCPITREAVERACQRAHRRSRIRKPITPHSLRHYLPFPDYVVSRPGGVTGVVCAHPR